MVFAPGLALAAITRSQVVGGFWGEEIRGIAGNLVHFVQRTQIIYHPKAAALGGSNKVAVFNGKVRNRYLR